MGQGHIEFNPLLHGFQQVVPQMSQTFEGSTLLYTKRA